MHYLLIKIRIKIKFISVWLILCLCVSNLNWSPLFNGISEARADAQSEIDKLRSLGYLDYAPAKADLSKKDVTRFDPQKVYPGYRLYTVQKECVACLIDLKGKVVKSWKEEPCRKWSNAELLSNGDLLVPNKVLISGKIKDPDGDPHSLLRMSWDGAVLWNKKLNAHHDTEITPQNSILTLTIHDRKASPFGEEVVIRDNRLVWLSQEGEEFKFISLLNVMLENNINFELQPVTPKEKIDVIDLFHVNSVECMRDPELAKKHPLYDLNNVLIAIRHQDCIAVINSKEKKLVWVWGRGEVIGPHDAAMLENGNILLFDNGLGRDWSRVIEINPLTNKIVWEYKKKDFYTAARGSNQRLPNGNTLIANSDSGQAFEITPDKKVVWEFWSPFMNEDGHRTAIVRIKNGNCANKKL